MKLQLLAIGAALAAVGPAVAADVDKLMLVSDMQHVEGTFDWTGGYVGLSVGGEKVKASSPTIGSIAGTDYLVGLYGGYNFGSGPYIFGIEGDAYYTSFQKSVACPNPVWTCSADLKWQGSLRARAGYAINTALFYATGGLSIARADGSTSLGANSFPDSHTLFGYTLGAGVEVAFNDNLIGRAEYRYSGYIAQDYTFDVIYPDVFLRSHQATIGLAYKF